MGTHSTYRIAGAQVDVQLGEKQQNLDKMVAMMEQAAIQGARLVIFPECALTGYCFESLEEALPYAEPLHGPSVAFMQEVCKKLNLNVAYGFLEAHRKADGHSGIFNAVALVGPNGVVGSYRKVHLPHLGIDHFSTPGDRPFIVHDMEGLRLGLNICYDSAFPEAARIMSLQGADLIVLPTNFPPGAECVVGHVIHARAMENAVYFAAINRIGYERGFTFIGGSKICDTDGHTMAEAGSDQEQLLFADIDPQLARNKLRVRRPGKHYIDRFADRRPDMYGPLLDP